MDQFVKEKFEKWFIEKNVSNRRSIIQHPPEFIEALREAFEAGYDTPIAEGVIYECK